MRAVTILLLKKENRRLETLMRLFNNGEDVRAQLHVCLESIGRLENKLENIK